MAVKSEHRELAEKMQKIVHQLNALILSELNGDNWLRRTMLEMRDSGEDILDSIHASIPHPQPPHFTED